MRELNFRVWNDNEKKMLYFDFEGIDGGYVFTAHDRKGNLLKEQTDIEEKDVMQYTGLKDKNGKDIYENDIVMLPEGETKQILFIAGSFCFLILEKMAHAPLSQFILGGYGNPPSQTSLEVIGNKFENPELIK